MNARLSGSTRSSRCPTTSASQLPDVTELVSRAGVRVVELTLTHGIRWHPCRAARAYSRTPPSLAWFSVPHEPEVDMSVDAGNSARLPPPPTSRLRRHRADRDLGMPIVSAPTELCDPPAGRGVPTSAARGCRTLAAANPSPCGCHRCSMTDDATDTREEPFERNSCRQHRRWAHQGMSSLLQRNHPNPSKPGFAGR